MDTEKRQDKVDLIIPGIMLMFVVSTCYFTWYFLGDYEERGTLGDMILIKAPPKNHRQY